MDKDDFRFWTIILGAIGLAFAAVIGSAFVVCHHIEKMAELGYEEEPVPGVEPPHVEASHFASAEGRTEVGSRPRVPRWTNAQRRAE